MNLYRNHLCMCAPTTIVCIASVGLLAVGCENAPQRAAAGTSVAPVVAAAAPAEGSPSPEVAHVCSDDQWVAFDGEAGEFEALFPPGAKPTREDDAVDTPIGAQQIVRFVCADRDAGYDAGYLIRSKSPLAALAGVNRILDAACEGTAKHLGGRVVASTRHEVDGHVARDIEIELPADGAHPHGAHATARLIITENRIYHAIVRNDRGTQPAPHATRFIAALRAGEL